MEKFIHCFSGSLEHAEKASVNLAKRIDDKKVITLISQKSKEPVTGYVKECWIDLDQENDNSTITVLMEVSESGTD